ncbi:MAG: site-specific DNA-methyltransferase, partial [Rectinemataceae bacterium]
MSPKYEKLKTLLRELFQLDQPDLDFGIYRIMHARSAEIGKFLDEELLPQVSASFAAYQPADKAAIKAELEKAIAQAQALGADPETLPKVKELRAKLADEAVDIAALEGEVYDHLYSFFRRYYSEGDFISKRVYKEGVYAIPYEGEEVKLHWANSDQYYIKTSEYLRDYAFRLQPDHPTDQMRVHFRLVDAAEGEHGNVKEAEGKSRVFILAAGDFIAEEQGELVIKFEYRPATLHDWLEAERDGKTKPPTQKELLSQAEKRILAATGTGLSRWMDLLGDKHRLSSGEQADYARLAAHLNRYTARNTFDYFIHKDLGGFLKRELDFYIKNEVMHLDDVENESAPRVEQYLSKIKVIRKIATKIIDFLAQLENFQKKLWLKKKFVVETNYCITLDRIPEEFYPEIAANDAQREEWVRLFSINGISKKLGDLITNGSPGYSVPLSVDFLKANNKLVLDTKYFSLDFTNRLISSIEDLDSNSDGLLIHSENFQAINLIRSIYKDHIDCVYIDPPYNTAASAICYKNEYKSSSWLSLMQDRIALSCQVLLENGILIAAIDDFQFKELSFLLSQLFHEVLGTFAVRSNPSGRPTQTGYAVSHEYLIAAGKSQKSAIGRLPATDDQAARFTECDEKGVFEWRNLRREGSNSDRSARPALYYPIFIKNGRTVRVPKMEWQEETKKWVLLEQPGRDESVVYPNNDDGDEKTWRWEGRKVETSKDAIAVRKDRSGKDYIYYKRRPNEDGVVAVSSWFDAKYSSVEHGTAMLKDILGSNQFSYPKSLFAVKDSIYISGAREKNALVLDFFAGSGTTGHAVIDLNREDRGARKYVLVELGEYFDTVLKPRIEKVVYCDNWEDGEPT